MSESYVNPSYSLFLFQICQICCVDFYLEICGGMNPGTKPSPSHDDPEEHRNDVKSCCVRQVMLKIAPSRVITIGADSSNYRGEITPVTH